MRPILFSALLLLLPVGHAPADEPPWGRGKLTPTVYGPQKVVYDVTSDRPDDIEHVLDRASYLSTITGADPFDQSIVLVLHGSSIGLFAIENTAHYRKLMQRAESLVTGEVLKIKMCKVAADSKGYRPDDIHGFVELVPMGDAEIIRLQYEEGHAYMQ